MGWEVTRGHSSTGNVTFNLALVQAVLKGTCTEANMIFWMAQF